VLKVFSLFVLVSRLVGDGLWAVGQTGLPGNDLYMNN
jgi:hypothetical protein